MTTAKRMGKRWSVNEILQLQREYELLKLSLDEIANKHQRTVNAIMFKLHAEGIIHYNFLYGKYYNAYPVVELNPSLSEDESYSSEDEDEDDECEDEDNDGEDEDNEYDSIEDLADRVWSLETNIKNIGSMISEMFHSWKTSKNSVNFSNSHPL